MAWMKNEHGEWKHMDYPYEDSDKDLDIGQSFCYPFDRRGFKRLMEIPEIVARVWLEQLGIRLNPQYDATDPARNCNQWLNKLAVVVDVDWWTYKALCLYNHDGSYSVVARVRED